MGRTPLVVRRLTDDVSALEVGDGDVEKNDAPVGDHPQPQPPHRFPFKGKPGGVSSCGWASGDLLYFAGISLVYIFGFVFKWRD